MKFEQVVTKILDLKSRRVFFWPPDIYIHVMSYHMFVTDTINKSSLCRSRVKVKVDYNTKLGHIFKNYKHGVYSININ